MPSNNLMNSWILNAPNPKHREKFASFDKLSDAADVFLSKFLHKIPKYKVFWKVCSIIFVLSYGQSAVERGFSINKDLLVDNLQEKSLVSQRRYTTTSNPTKLPFTDMNSLAIFSKVASF